MKSLILALVLCLTGRMSAHSPTEIEIHSTIDGGACEGDAAERSLLIERKTPSGLEKVGVYNGKGCLQNLDLDLEAGEYVLTFTGLAFETQTVDFTVTEANRKNLVIGTVLLLSKTTELNQVTIYGNKRQYVKVESDKTTISVRENGLLNSGTSLDAVKRLPGVVKAPGGSLSLNGKGVTIYIDGAPSSLTGTDLENYLNSLPANAIEKVELIYNPGAAYDANASGSIINIVTSTKRMKGINASFNINYNFNKYQKPSPQILLNGKEKNVSWQTMLGYNYIEGENYNRTLQDFTYFTPAKQLDQRNLATFHWRNWYWRSGANYKINDRSNLLFNYNVHVSNDEVGNDATTTGPDIDYRNNAATKFKTASHEAVLQYKVKLDTIGRTLDVTAYGNYFGRGTKLRGISSEDAEMSYNNSNINFDMYNYYLKYDFAIPFEKWNFSINTGGKFNVLKVTDLGKYNFDSDTDAIFNSGVYASTIDFDYTENNLAFYAEARKKFGKLNLTAGLRFEDFDVTREASTVADRIKFVNNNLFPTFNAMYELTDKMNVSGSYTRKIAQPGYFTIDPNINNSYNKYNTSVGNLALRPIFFNNFEFRFSAFDFVQAGVNYSVSTDNNQFMLEAADGELVSNRTFVAFDRMKVLGAYFNFPIPLDYIFKGKAEFQNRMGQLDKMNYIMANIGWNKTMTEGYPLGYPNKGTFNFGFQSQILLPWGITNNMSYFILPKGVWEIYRIDKPIQSFDISFNKDFMDKKLRIGLHAFDVFNVNQVNAFVTGKNLDTRFYEKQDSRVFRVSLTYNFGNLKLEKENTDINVEKANGGGGGL